MHIVLTLLFLAYIIDVAICIRDIAHMMEDTDKPVTMALLLICLAAPVIHLALVTAWIIGHVGDELEYRHEQALLSVAQ